MIDTGRALCYTLAAGLAVFFCRAFPFLALRSGRRGGAFLEKILEAVEKTVPPVAMTVLALGSVVPPLIGAFSAGDLKSAVAVLLAVLFTLAAQVWRRNYLLSILGGTALYMALLRLLPAWHGG